MNTSHLASILLGLSLALPWRVHAAAIDTSSVGIEQTFQVSEPADLVIANRPIITLRAEVFGNKPAQRVKNIEKRLDEWFAEHDTFVLTDSSLFGGKGILMNGSPLMFITALDVDPTEGENVEQVTQRTKARLLPALNEYRELHDERAMMRNVAFIALDSVVLIAVLWALGWLRRWLRLRIERFIRRSMERTGVKSGLSRGNTLVLVGKRMAMVLIGLLMLIAIYAWLTAVLGRFPLTRAWSEQMFGLVSMTALWFLNGIIAALPGLGVVAIVFLLTRWITRLVSGMFDRIAQGEVEVDWLDANIAAPVKRIVVLMVWIFAVVIAYPYIPGSESKAFQGIGVLAGLMLSLGSSSVVSQAAAGMVIMFNRVIRVGEAVAISESAAGVVKRIGYFNTVIVNSYGEEVTVPNSEVLGSTITNRSRHGGNGVHFTTGVTIGYDAPWRQVHAMLVEAANSTPGIARTPVPVVNQHSLDDFYVNYKLTIVIEGPFRATLTALHAAIQDAFNANGVQIMSPHYEGDPAQAKVVPPEKRDPGTKSH
ncbi:MAG: mechanosensitive ion channel family protein [Flavobacteriales bacterium]|nr:mechanosensitive ion channel family protein [Flavobacteriales bacterium]